MRKLSIALLVVAMASVGLAHPAAADTAVRADGNDSPGLLDMKRVLHRHAGGGILVHKLKTFEKWDWSIFEDLSDARFSFFVNAGSREDRTLTVSTSADGTPYAEMRTAGNAIVGYARVWKPSPRSLQVEFPKSLLGKKVSRYRWRVSTTFHTDDHPKCGTSGNAIVMCEDVAPNRGKKKIRHRLG